jgi:hypothetical protein
LYGTFLLGLNNNKKNSVASVRKQTILLLTISAFFAIKSKVVLIFHPEIKTEQLRLILWYSRLSIIRAWFNRFAAQPRQCIFKEKNLFSVSITFV